MSPQMTDFEENRGGEEEENPRFLPPPSRWLQALNERGILFLYMKISFIFCLRCIFCQILSISIFVHKFFLSFHSGFNTSQFL